mmetsp:Transcript_402/g.1030  ORF Transcript_402/g.1030 Transcript_402/m.1030 type:complete len:219 (-) Transcript_402:67-723(-)
MDSELGRTMAHFNQERRKNVHAATRSLVVPITISWTTPDNGTQTLVRNGFFYREGYNHLLSCAHLARPNATYHATLFNKTEVSLELVLCNTSEDIAVFHMNEVPPHPSRPCATTAKTGDTCFVVGFKPSPSGTMDPFFSEGVVSFASEFAPSGCRMLITAYADNGLSGSPVLNLDGLLIGMIRKGDGQTTQQAEAIPTSVIYLVLGGAEEIPNIVSGY